TLGLGRRRGAGADGEEAAGETSAAGTIGQATRVDVAEGEDHMLSIDRTGAGGATVMLRSEPRPLGQWLDTLAGLAAREVDANRKATAEQKIGEARRLLGRLDPVADQAAASRSPDTANASAQAGTLQAQLSPVLKEIFDNLSGA